MGPRAYMHAVQPPKPSYILRRFQPAALRQFAARSCSRRPAESRFTPPECPEGRGSEGIKGFGT